MSQLHLNHIKASMKDKFSPYINLSEVTNENERRFISKAFIAYTLHALASTNEEESCNAIVDGTNDNGIDGIHYDSSNKILWVAQSKWHDDGGKSFDKEAALKLIKGIEDLIDLKFDNFNESTKKKEQIITSAMKNAKVKIEVAIAYNSNKPLSSDVQQVLDEFLVKINDVSELVKLNVFTIKEAHDFLTSSYEGVPINCDIMLHKYGSSQEPYLCFYGLVNAKEVALLVKKYGQSLFKENIRSFIGETDVNKAIKDTLEKTPENFSYFNNGITMIADSVDKKPMGGSNNQSGVFECCGLKIVNGAQTAGTIGSIMEGKHALNLDKATMLVKLVSLSGTPEGFGEKITKSANTQNKIDNRDFVSLDPTQLRLAKELLPDDIIYNYKRGHKDVLSKDQFTLEEATISLCCANKEARYAVQVKREIGKIWENTSKGMYVSIFNDSLKGNDLWRSVQVYRVVDSLLKEKEKSQNNKEKGLSIHGNRFILHLIFCNLGQEYLQVNSEDFKEILDTKIKELFNSLFEISLKKLEEKYPNSIIGRLFLNQTKCKNLKDFILTEWRTREHCPTI